MFRLCHIPVKHQAAVAVEILPMLEAEAKGTDEGGREYAHRNQLNPVGDYSLAKDKSFDIMKQNKWG